MYATGDMEIESGPWMFERSQGASQEGRGCDAIGVVVTIHGNVLVLGNGALYACERPVHIDQCQRVGCSIIAGVKEGSHLCRHGDGPVME